VRNVRAVVLAAGRLVGSHPGGTPKPKALLEIGGRRLLDAVLEALWASGVVEQVSVVAPRALFDVHAAVDVWIEDRGSDADNVMAALEAIPAGRLVLCASDLAFIRGSHVKDFLQRIPDDADIAYPVFTREEFLTVFPGGRTAFARVGNTWWTGGSLCLLQAEAALAHANLVCRAFRARKSLLRLATMLGPRLLVRHLAGSLTPEDVAARVGDLTGWRALAVRGADPALAFDCDSWRDVEYARRRSRADPWPA
jgi:molybdopterin-guanine dinucleotide biosynthesis protein A